MSGNVTRSLFSLAGYQELRRKRKRRLTNAFSKKWEHLRAMLALYFAYYNFCKVHSSLRVTPAMESGITDHVWSLTELLMA